jgi:hypothetical protein
MASPRPRDHTRRALSRMQLGGSVPANLDRDNDAKADDYGTARA